MITGIDHLVVAVASPDAAAAVLERELGLAFSGGGRHESMGTWNRLAFLGDAYLELIGVFDAGLVRSSPAFPVGAAALDLLEAGREGLATYALASDDIAADVARLQSAGSPIREPVPGSRRRPDGDEVRWLTAFPVVPAVAAGSVSPAVPAVAAVRASPAVRASTAASATQAVAAVSASPAVPASTAASASPAFGADRLPFLIQHELQGAEWGPDARAARAVFRQPVGDRVRLATLVLPVDDASAVADAYGTVLGIAFSEGWRAAVGDACVVLRDQGGGAADRPAVEPVLEPVVELAVGPGTPSLDTVRFGIRWRRVTGA